MRIVIDLQAAQTESRFRGIGRYSMAFAKAVCEHRGKHEILIALNGFFKETIEPIRGAFDGLLPQENIRVWYAPGPFQAWCSEEQEEANERRRRIAEYLREDFLKSLHPDLIHISSMIEGYEDSGVTSIKKMDQCTPVSITAYDLIPLYNPDHYLKPNPQFAAFYHEKLEQLKRADLLLAISDSSTKEHLESLGLSESQVINKLGAMDEAFKPLTLDQGEALSIYQKFSIQRPYILYTGGADERKNLPRLIQAFSGLPTSLRGGHQLLLAGRMPEFEILKLKKEATKAGLRKDELIFTNYVSDQELIQLYNLATVFVFPSWHEGFGLPALEAMACGTPTIASNTSSMPEIIGLKAALFDPFDIPAITALLAKVLEDHEFRERLCQHALKRSAQFSWDNTAKRALRAWEELVCPIRRSVYPSEIPRRQLMHYLGPRLTRASHREIKDLSSVVAQNAQNGIERQWLIDVSEISQRDAGTGIQRVVRNYLKRLLYSPPRGIRVEPVYATTTQGYKYARNYTQRVFGQKVTGEFEVPITWQRGDVFFGLDTQHHVQLAQASFFETLKRDGVCVLFLVHDLLPIQLGDLFDHSDIKALHEAWLSMIAKTDGAISVSAATASAFTDWLQVKNIQTDPYFRMHCVHNGADFEGSEAPEKIGEEERIFIGALKERPTFLCVSTIEPRKRQKQILKAFERLWEQEVEAQIVFVGQRGWNVDDLIAALESHPERGRRLFWLEGISDDFLKNLYSVSTCLIAASLNEGFGLSLLEGAHFKLPIIARDIPVFREIAGEGAYYFEGLEANDLARSIEEWLRLYWEGQHPRSSTIPFSTWSESYEKLKPLLQDGALSERQILVDISEIVSSDSRTGIQRVVRSILKEWLLNPPKGYRIEPIYALNRDGYVLSGYRYARKFSRRFMGLNDIDVHDELVEHAPGDIYFALDLNHHVPRKLKAYLDRLYRDGVKVMFLVYDILPLQFPHFWPPKFLVHEIHEEWLTIVSNYSGAICISKSVADDLENWFEKKAFKRERPFHIDWFHLGSNIEQSVPTQGLPDDACEILEKLKVHPSFLMVGTLEPRKGHAQVLQAFEALWCEKHPIFLVIVGKEGWMVEELASALRNHKELGKRLFWFEESSDEFLEKIYSVSTSLIAASYGEGFGLPIIEAAQHNLPIIARDIAVFREVAGENAFYFKAMDGMGLSKAILEWLSLYDQEDHPTSTGMTYNDWKTSASDLIKKIIKV